MGEICSRLKSYAKGQAVDMRKLLQELSTNSEWNWFISVKIDSSGDISKHANETSGFMKTKICVISKAIINSQETNSVHGTNSPVDEFIIFKCIFCFIFVYCR